MDDDHMQFLEIAYELELKTDESPELDDLAFELCNEVPATRTAYIQELRDMIYDLREFTPHRTDDAFLLRFLRSRGFVVRRAYKHMMRYYNFRAKYPHLYKDMDVFSFVKIRDAYLGCLINRPEYGRITVMRFGSWDPSEYPAEDLVKAGMFMIEVGLRKPMHQIMGGTLIVDMSGLSIKHVTTLTPTIAYQITALSGEAWNMIYFHGSDMKSLHQHIDPSSLPPLYGGTSLDYVTYGEWIKKIKKYRDDEFVNEMKDLGYMVKK